MSVYTGGDISVINNILRDRDIADLQKAATYKLALWALIEKVCDLKSLMEGSSYVTRLQTKQPKNAQSRSELGDYPLPLPPEFIKTSIHPVEYVATTGITQRQLDRATSSDTAAANLVEIKLSDLKADIRRRANAGIGGDGTGRLARISVVTGSGQLDGSANTSITVTIDNTSYDFGWPHAQMLVEGMMVDVYTPDLSGADGAAWTKKITNAQITNIVVASNDATASFTLSFIANVSSYAAALADNDVIFMGGVVQSYGTAAGSLTDSRYLEMQGLLHLVDDGSLTTPWSSPGAGSWFQGYGSNAGKAIIQGIDRTTQPMLRSKVTRWFNGDGTPGSWSENDLQNEITERNMANTEGEISHLIMHPYMASQLTRKAAAAQNAVVNISNGEITGGFFSTKLRTSDGNLVPIVTATTCPRNSIFGICAEDIQLYMPVDFGFFKYGAPENGPFFPAPGARNATFESWFHCEGTPIALRCDNHFAMHGLRTDEA